MSRLVAARRGLPGMAPKIPLEQAERFVARGMARFTSDAKRKVIFLDCHQKRSAEIEARASQTAGGYEDIHRRLSQQEMAAIPILQPGKLLRRRTKTAY